jgi:acyl-CoA dehydrogenase
VARNVLKGYQPHPGLWPTEYIPAKRDEARKKYASLIESDPDLAAWADAAVRATSRG